MSPQVIESTLGHDDLYNYLHPDPQEVELAIPDSDWIADQVPQIKALRKRVVDDSPDSMGAELVSNMMVEFAEEGSNFQPSLNKELVDFIKEVVAREVPGISEDGISELISYIDDFPPLDGVEKILANRHRAYLALAKTATREDFVPAA